MAQKQQDGRVKKSFMLHDVDGMHKIGKYMSNTFRQAALKAASNNHNRVILRQTGTKICKEFTCKIQVLDEPKIIKRGDKEIKYSKIPEARWVRTFTMENAALDADEEAAAPRRKRSPAKPKSAAGAEPEPEPTEPAVEDEPAATA